MAGEEEVLVVEGFLLSGRYPVALALGYLLGAIPVTYFLTRWITGKDLRRHGTGSLSVSNTFRTAGCLLGAPSIFWHILLGFVVVLLARWLFPEAGQDLPAWVDTFCQRLPAWLRWLTPPLQVIPVWAVLGAFLGQNWTIFVRGASGRGRICFTSGMLLVAPLVVIASTLLWILGYALGRRPERGATVSDVALPALMGVFTGSWHVFALGIVFAAVFLVQLGQHGHEWSRQSPSR